MYYIRGDVSAGRISQAEVRIKMRVNYISRDYLRCISKDIK